MELALSAATYQFYLTLLVIKQPALNAQLIKLQMLTGLHVYVTIGLSLTDKTANAQLETITLRQPKVINLVPVHYVANMNI